MRYFFSGITENMCMFHDYFLKRQQFLVFEQQVFFFYKENRTLELNVKKR